MSSFPTPEQKRVLENDKDRAIVSASAGTGKTTTLIAYIADLVKAHIPISRLLVVTFTNNAANEMKERLLSKLMELKGDDWILDQIDDILVSDISTMHSFLQKIIKRNIDKLSISNDYYLLDESKSREIRNKAFENAYERACEENRFLNMLLVLHSKKDRLKNITLALENHFSVLASPNQAFETYKNNQEEIYKKATANMNKLLVDRVFSFTQRVAKILDKLDPSAANYKYIKNYISVLQTVTSENTLRENICAIQNFKFGSIKTKAENLDFQAIRVLVEKLKNKYKSEEFSKEEFWKPNPLVLDVYDFYKLYEEELEKIKLSENCIDFNDLEKFSLKLLQDEKVIGEIQKNYDYVIIDEYQDTNPVQEKIMKILSEKCKFLAVGDPKQGIYGFRNATSEIMKQDIRDFSEDGGVYYLKSNFRSDPIILDFVNEVFGNIMKEENTGIDYNSTSLFKYDKDVKYPESELPSVRIDVLNLKNNKEPEEVAPLYDIEKAKLVSKDKCKEQAELIAGRINELLLSKIYDAKKGCFRNVNFSDITILVRGRGEVAERITEELTNQNIPVISSLEKEISSNEEVEVIKNLLKICVDFEDDISLASVLSSKIGGLSLEELCDIRQDKKNKAFYEEFKESDKYASFICELNKFKINCYALGIKAALERLFNEREYNAYLLSKKDGINIKNQIDKLLDIIENSGCNYDIPALLVYLQSNDIKISGINSGLNAVTITTMHASKGLEYPIVILPGMDKELNRTDARGGGNSFKISSSYGLALENVDYSSGEVSKNVLLSAIEQEKSRKEFVDEIMLLYVAMTRAKNHLYIVGEEKPEDVRPLLSAEEVFENTSYLRLIISSLMVNNEDLNKSDHFEKKGFEFNVFDSVVDLKKNSEQKITTSNEEYVREIDNYLNFSYPNKLATEMRYKQSVTMINQQAQSEEKSGIKGEGVDVGIAYHSALEKLDLLNINSEEDIRNNLSEEELNLIDVKILLKSINILKPLLKDKKIYKEKVFTMRARASEIVNTNLDEDIMIQGIVDLFLIGEKNILIDYKFTNIKDEKILINKYKNQLFIYKKAIESAYMLHLDEIYLLSLKYDELIKIN